MTAAKRILSMCLALCIVIVLVPFSTAEASDTLSSGQENIVKRARQLIEIEWTPLFDRYQWGYYGVFTAGVRYKGVPYGQPVNAAYIGFDVSVSDFIAATENSESRFYTQYSYYNKIAPYYSIDCSGFVSYAWDLPVRRTTRNLHEVSYYVEDQSINGLEVGDALNNASSHAALVTDVVRNADGEVVTVEIMEQTPVIARRTVYGEGGSISLQQFNMYYFGGGYVILRYNERDSVEYEHICEVPIDGDSCENCTLEAPRVRVSGSGDVKTVSLSHVKSGANIYYTLDGTEPGPGASLYTQPITVYDTVTLKAAAVADGYNDGRVLTYTVRFPQTEKPACVHSAGLINGTVVSKGSKMELKCSTPGAKIYYTLDGTEPGTDSQLYTSPFIISGDTTIKALAVAEGYKPSETGSWSYTVGSFISFDDVSASSWYYDAVSYAYSMGLFSGVSHNLFAPENTMTRGMFVSVLSRIVNVPQSTGGYMAIITGDNVNVRSGPGTNNSVIGTVNNNYVVEIIDYADGWYKVLINGGEGYIIEDYVKAYDGYFLDLDNSQYYSSAVQWAYLTGITSGTGDGKFCAEESISREDMAIMLYNYLKVYSLDLSLVKDREIFTDDSSISVSHKTAVYLLQQAGVINGMGNGLFQPHSDATRSQVAQIFKEFTMAVK